MGVAKFRVHIPCSVWAGIVPQENDGTVKPRQIKAVLEHGHGLFEDRNEASSYDMQHLADDAGYIVTSMDWRGMSVYDFPIVFKALVATPRLFQAVRDNLIQGYACKLALQHFSREAMFALDWVAFESNGVMVKPRILNPSFVFYGNSQGGILGAGYVALSGPTKLIERAVLGVTGAPLARILPRLFAFKGYQELLLLNFQNNRHIRMIIAVMQMTFDSTEGSGFLAEPVTEPYPPILIQAGLGDATVPMGAAEALARGFGAKLLPHHPQEIYGLSEDAPVKANLGGEVVFTEFLFEQEYDSLPKNDVVGTDTLVHDCLRKDKEAIRQVKEFVSTGKVIDVCEKDNYVRDSISC
jgi:hypothetical protein